MGGLFVYSPKHYSSAFILKLYLFAIGATIAVPSGTITLLLDAKKSLSFPIYTIGSASNVTSRPL